MPRLELNIERLAPSTLNRFEESVRYDARDHKSNLHLAKARPTKSIDALTNQSSPSLFLPSARVLPLSGVPRFLRDLVTDWLD